MHLKGGAEVDAPEGQGQEQGYNQTQTNTQSSDKDKDMDVEKCTGGGQGPKHKHCQSGKEELGKEECKWSTCLSERNTMTLTMAVGPLSYATQSINATSTWTLWKGLSNPTSGLSVYKTPSQQTPSL
ncbi:hypothetical protein L210DRAFT_3503939 [Boletus edulis BED1]|uniref:Uncharacterized protein n=1 Tax=Boletus edulis BED1 TaxID=1328754 RepID=A0AAD4BV43_BOLED|nr:hypothetical protein L210DRAFT_3503939 [Boletus edulis BED1]